jgi:Tfp pilus assembly protein PilN
MKASIKTAIGIDVTETQVAAVLLKRAQDGVHVLQATRMPLPEGSIVHGRIVDTDALLSALKTLRTQHGLRAQQFAVSLPVAGALARVVPLEATDPQDIADYVQGEVGQYAAFSGRETVSDFRVLVPATQKHLGKVLVTAADREAVGTLVGVCRRAGIQTTIVEPAITVCARVFRGAKQQDHRLLAVRKDGALSLCVLQRGILDFMRTKPIGPADAGLSGVYQWMADEINAVIQFYDIERPDGPRHWAVTVIDDDGDDVPADARQGLETRACAEFVQFWNGSNALPQGVVYDGDQAGLSSTAIGLAMRLLDEEGHGPCMNLLGQEAGQAGVAKRRVLLMANVLAAMVPVIVVVAGALSYVTGCVHHHIGVAKQEELAGGDRALATAVDGLTHVEERIAALETELDCLNRASASRLRVDWCHLLADIESAIPSVLRITELSLKGSSGICIEGVSKSDEAVDVFLDMLNQSDHIGRASLLQKGRASSDAMAIQYAIRCSPPRGKI